MTNPEADLKDKQIKSTEEFEIKYDGVHDEAAPTAMAAESHKQQKASVYSCTIISTCCQVVDTVSYGIKKAQTESSPSMSSLYETLT